jgi:glutathione S-transferase
VRLFHLPGSRSTRVLWLLEEIGEPYDLTILTREEKSGPEHGERHPLNRVPVIEEDGGYVFESAAICLDIADRHLDKGLVPPVGTHERALVYQWVIFAVTELEPYGFQAIRETDPERKKTAGDRYALAVAAVERALGEREYLVGDSFTVADLICGAVLSSGKRGGLTDPFPQVSAYVERLEERPARVRANERTE